MTLKEKLETIKGKKGKKIAIWCKEEWYLENGFNLVIYKKFIEDIDKVIITNQDISDLLNDKYGKDNWVIK